MIVGSPGTTALEDSRLESSPTLSPHDGRQELIAHRNSKFFDWLVFFLCFAAVYALLPLWAPLVLAAWTAIATAPIVNRASSPHRRRRAAAIATALAVAITLPLVVMGLFLSKSLSALIDQVQNAPDKNAALRSILTDGAGLPARLDVNGLITALKEYSRGALSTFNVVMGATIEAAIGVTIFILATYTFLMSGKGLYIWALDRLPFPRGHMHRLGNAFVETGRGLFLGIGLTALLQGVAAGLGYFVLQVPQAGILALLTTLAALIPTFGTALIWVPVSVGLLLVERPVAAVIMVAIGVVISSVDNFIRPMLARKGDLQMPTFVVFLAMLGGLAAFGGFGLMLGPLAVRLAVEGLEIVSAQDTQH